MELKNLGLGAIVSAALVGNVNVQEPVYYLTPPSNYQTIVIQPTVVILQNHQTIRNFPCRMEPAMWITPREIKFNLKYLEPGLYRTIIEKKDFCYVLGGLEKTFKMEPATPGYIIPNDQQITQFHIPTEGTYDLYACGKNWCLKLGTTCLSVGDKVNFEKIVINPLPQNSQ